MEKLNSRWEEGIFIGVESRSGEYMVCTTERIHFSKYVYRVPESRRWGEDCLNWVKWAPWNRYSGDEFAEGDVPEGVPEEERPTPPSIEERIKYVNTRSRVSAEFPIHQQDAREHGRTRGCPGCMSLFRGRGTQKHTLARGERFKGILWNSGEFRWNS